VELLQETQAACHAGSLNAAVLRHNNKSVPAAWSDSQDAGILRDSFRDGCNCREQPGLRKGKAVRAGAMLNRYCESVPGCGEQKGKTGNPASEV
jgi:hypothetical protein